MQLTLLVLRCKNIEISKNFYEKLGLKFQQEQHGKGPIYYSTEIGEVLLELYPLQENYQVENNRLGFSLEVEDVITFLKSIEIEIQSTYTFDKTKVFVVEDPDGRKVELTNE